MKDNIKVVFFDLFYTLVKPSYGSEINEYDILNITCEEWEKYAEEDKLYTERAKGNIIAPEEILKKILMKMEYQIKEDEFKELLNSRIDRYKRAMIDVDEKIIEILKKLRGRGIKLCLISNADAIDVLHWEKSVLSNLFHERIFSFEEGYVKPQREIYEIAMRKMNVEANECVFIGDGGSEELKGAKECGISTVKSNYLLDKELLENVDSKSYADFTVEKFKEIEDII